MYLPADHTPLLNLDELERLQGLILERRDKRRAVSSPYSGPVVSHHRGYGMELHDVRPYHPGDDIRHMDWRATARSNKPTTKVFLEERQRNLFLVVDRRPPMRFGTRGEIKAACAARVAAIMAFTALAAQEHVTGLTIDNTMTDFSAARTLHGVFPFIRAMTAPFKRVKIAAENTPVDAREIYEHLSRRAERGSTICIISDFHDTDAQHKPALQYLADHFETIALRIIDPAEEMLQGTGRMRVTSPVTGKTTVIDTDDADIRRRYNEIMTRHSAALKEIFIASGIQYAAIHNNKDAFQQLSLLS
jgi:uncharacterized protein (DUF58 family)